MISVAQKSAMAAAYRSEGQGDVDRDEHSDRSVAKIIEQFNLVCDAVPQLVDMAGMSFELVCQVLRVIDMSAEGLQLTMNLFCEEQRWIVKPGEEI